MRDRYVYWVSFESLDIEEANMGFFLARRIIIQVRDFTLTPEMYTLAPEM